MADLDVTVENHGTIFTFWLHTDAAVEWAEENVEVPGYMLISDDSGLASGFHCEHRYAQDIAQGMLDAGLRVK